MARKDAYHDIVRTALEADGWTITNDPLSLAVGRIRVHMDLGAKQSIAAEKGSEKIAVEIKNFMGPSDLNEFEKAIGQYLLYDVMITLKSPGRRLYLAVPETAYNGIFSELAVQILVKNQQIRLIIYDEVEGRITQWIDERNTNQS
jgi:hypothetical protein